MRPPTVRRSSGAPSLGQVLPRTRARCRSPVWEPPRRVSSAMVDRRWRCSRRSSLGSRSDAGRAGSSPARHSISSTSRLPMPAMWSWSSRRALSGALLRAEHRLQPRRRDRRGLEAEARLVRVELDRAAAGAGPACAGRRRRRSAGRSGPTSVRCGRGRTRAARSGRCRRPAAARSCRSAGRAHRPARPWSSTTSSSRRLPIRRAAENERPSSAPRSASAVVPRLRYQASGASTAAMVRSSAPSASCR